MLAKKKLCEYGCGLKMYPQHFMRHYAAKNFAEKHPDYNNKYINHSSYEDRKGIEENDHKVVQDGELLDLRQEIDFIKRYAPMLESRKEFIDGNIRFLRRILTDEEKKHFIIALVDGEYI